MNFSSRMASYYAKDPLATMYYSKMYHLEDVKIKKSFYKSLLKQSQSRSNSRRMADTSNSRRKGDSY
jgi:hypothetical protein